MIRILRLLRIIRILKLSEYLQKDQILMSALGNSSRKIMVFLYAVLTIVVVFGALMYAVESNEAGFTCIPTSIYWAIVTVTTAGYGIIAVSTGIYCAELYKTYNTDKIRNDACPDCGKTGHDFDSDYCKYCGYQLDVEI